jgi:rSAM/selenodomain-associated transferase 1
MSPLIVFAKGPTPGEVKTRLAEALGAEGAAEIYRAMARDTIRTACSTFDRVLLAYQPTRRFPDAAWLGSHAGVEVFMQTGRDLGEKLEHAFAYAFAQAPGPVMTIGSDLPLLTSSLLRDAAKRARETDVVLGPTHDGGYYLIGLSKPSPTLFKGIAWSTPHVWQSTIDRLREARLNHAELMPLTDLDTLEDLRPWLHPDAWTRLAASFPETAQALENCSTSLNSR